MRRNVLRNSAIIAYIDNDSGLCALIRGDSNAAAIADMCEVFWRALQKYGIDLRMGRLSPKLNIDDRPTRIERSLPYEVGNVPLFTSSLAYPF